MNSSEVRRTWADRTGEFSPAYYAYRGPDETSQVLRDLLDRSVDRDAAILSLGCSSGRHLAHLQRHGYEDLAGIEVNDEAFAVMADHYPDLAEDGTFYQDSIEATVGEFDDGAVDVVYSVETLQHVHPDADWVFDELARITGDLLITVEIEAGDGEPGEVNYVDDRVPLYYRDWGDVFAARGMTQVERRREGRDLLRAFEPGDR